MLKRLTQSCFLSMALLLTLATVGMTRAETVAGPHLTGDDYVALRQGVSPVLKFRIDLEVPQGNYSMNVAVGPDYVLETSPRLQRLYDFRHRRRLDHWRDEAVFQSISLFGAFKERYERLQLALSRAEQELALAGQQPSALTRIGVELRHGIFLPGPPWLARIPLAEFSIEPVEGVPTVMADRTPVIMVEEGPTGFPSADHRTAFLAWMVWSFDLHPIAAAMLDGLPNLPENMVLFRAGGSFPSHDNVIAEVTRLSVTDASMRSERLDVFAGLTQQVPGLESYLPRALIDIMVSAARGEAANGPISDAAYAAEIDRLIASERYLDAVLLGLHAAHPYDGCGMPNPPELLCSALRRALDAGKDRDDVGRVFVTALGNEISASRKAEILATLASGNLARPDILDVLRANELIEARHQGSLTPAQQAEFRALPELFLAAFRADPYNPARYKDLFNYLRTVRPKSGQGRLDSIAAFHNVIDLARALPDRRMPESLRHISRVEQRMVQDFPMMFPN